MGLPRPRPLEQAFARTAQELGRRFPQAEIGTLEYAARLSLLRRTVLGGISDPGRNGSGSEWDFAEQHGCPLLEPALDRLEPRGAYACSADAGLPGRDAEWGELYQALRGMSLARDETGGLVPERSQATRRQLGMFYTPVWMAERLSAMALGGAAPGGGKRRWPTRIFDPACGSGRLLRACAETLLAEVPALRRPEVLREELAGVIRGVDLDPVAVALCRTVFWLLSDPRRGPNPALSEMFVAEDSLLARPDQGPGAQGHEVIVANPPFEVLKGFGKRAGLREYVAQLRASGFAWSLSGSLNTSRLFLERSLQLLSEGGQLAIVLPAGFLMDQSAARLRGEMLRRGWIVEIEGYPESSRVFAGVGQSVILLHATKAKEPRGSFLVRDGQQEGQPVELTLSRLAEIDPETLPIPLSPGESYDLVGKLSRANPRRLSDLAEGKVGEVDQTFYRAFILSRPGGALLLRGAHLAPYRASLCTREPKERWLDAPGFALARPRGSWTADIQAPRIAQTGIVNMEATRRLVAAEVDGGVYFGNSLNYWIPRDQDGLSPELGRGYLLGLLNSAPWEWRFRFTSSNNNVNLYEVRSLPLPARGPGRSPDAEASQLTFAEEVIRGSDWHEGLRALTQGASALGREEPALVRLIAAVSRMRARADTPAQTGRLDRWLDALSAFHLGLSEGELLTIWTSLGR